MSKRRLISLDWALKKVLRSKANFGILEGFLSELLKDDIKIIELLESESNKARADDKFNRLDMKVKNQKGDIILIEIQYEREFDYLQRMLYGVSKAIVEHIDESDKYSNVVKVISVNILYFDLGQGKDYVYHGCTHFIGMHEHDELLLNVKQQQLFDGKKMPHELFPEYYLLKVNQFNDIAKDSLDEWIYFLKNEEISDKFKAKGLKEAKQALDILHLSDKERAEYEWYREDRRYQASMHESSFVVGRNEGRKEGRKEGLQEGQKEAKREAARQMKRDGLPLEKIVQYTGLTHAEIEIL